MITAANVSALAGEIDRRVYQPYGLAAEEIAGVEVKIDPKGLGLGDL